MFGDVGWRSCVGSKQSLKGNFDVSLEDQHPARMGSTGWTGAGAGAGSLEESWLESFSVTLWGKGFLCFVPTLKILGRSLRMMD